MMKIIKQKSLKEFFTETFDEAVSKNPIQLLDLTRTYLLDLLTEFIESDTAFSLEREYPEEPLSVLFLKALSKGGGEKVRDNKMIGDWCLFLSGFFPDYIQGKIADLDLYMTIGSRAYSNVESSLKKTTPCEEDLFILMYGELSNKFPGLVDIYMDMSDKMMSHSERDIIKIYDKYLLLRSERYRKLLRDAGIEHIPILKTKH